MKKLALLTLALCCTLVLLTACGNKDKTDGSKTSDKGTITVGLMSGYQPYEYQNEDGTYSGFDVDFITEALSRCGYDVDFYMVQWDGLLPALESGYCDVVSCQLARKDDRINKYYMGTVPYFEGGGALVVAADNSSITSLDDLAKSGDTIGVTVGDAWTAFLEQYNKDNNNALNLKYYSEDISTILQDIANGRIVATLNEPSVMKERAEVLGIADQLKILDGTLYDSYFASLAFSRTDDGKALRAELDKAITDMLNDGWLADLSVKYFGSDFTKNCLSNIDTRDKAEVAETE